jgi:hypothetical protein
VNIQLHWKLLLASFVFALCAAPTFVSYHPYTYEWDDSDYLVNSIETTRAVWSGDLRSFRMAVQGIHPPVMALLGLPWGTLASWDAAGKCFLSLATLTAFYATCCLFLMLRSGLNPLYLVIGSVCLLAAMGPFPGRAEVDHYWCVNYIATSFMVDTLFAWIAFAALLLIPYEIANTGSATRDGLKRGVLWAAIFSGGAVSKVNFFYFIAIIIPILFFIRAHNRGRLNAFVALLSLVICSLPAILYWIRSGAPALRFAWANSFGHYAHHFYYPLLPFLWRTVLLAPGLLLSGTLVLGEMAYLVSKRREIMWGENVLALLVLIGYSIIVLASSNREFRFLFTLVIALPFLVGIVASERTYIYSQKAAISAAALVFCCLVAAAVPVLHRAERQSIQRSEAVLAHSVGCNAKHILLATDSPTLNQNLMRLAIVLSPQRSSVKTSTLAWPPLADLPIEEDFRAIRESELVVFQNKEALNPPFTNQRVPEYERYARQEAGDGPIKVMDDVRIYTLRHRSQ